MEPFLTSLLSQEIEQADNHYLTFETLVLRMLRRISELFHIPWNHVLESTRQAPCLMDNGLHRDLKALWSQRNKSVTLEEQHCVERVLGRDYVRPADMTKLTSILLKVLEPRAVYEYFAMDGYLGDDPKKYVDAFRYEADDPRGKHMRAVRLLYRYGAVHTPQECRELLEGIFNGTNDEYREVYLQMVGDHTAEMAEWRRREQQEKTKKKRPAEEDCKEESNAKIVVTEETRSSTS